MAKEFKRLVLLSMLSCSILSVQFGCGNVKIPDWFKQDVLVEADQVDASSFPFFKKWLDRWGKNPLEYIVQKSKNHELVIIGEHHYIKDYLELVKQAIPNVYHRAGVRCLALEVCNAEDNEKIAGLIEGDKYDRDLAYEIARSQNWGLWGYKEYWDLLEAVWNLNKALPRGAEHMRVIGIDKAMDYQLDALWRANQLTDKSLIEEAKNEPDIYKRDEWMAKNIEDEIIKKGAKGIVLVGFNHSFVHYAQPKLNKEGTLESEWPRMANLLYQKYLDKIFQVGLHGEHSSPSVIDKNYKGRGPIFVDLIEKITASRENKPVGFDVAGSPFANIRDRQSYYFHWQPKVRFSDLSQGFVFLKPLKGLSPCTWMDNFISDEMFEKSKTFYEFTYKRKFANSREVNEFFKKGLGSV